MSDDARVQAIRQLAMALRSEVFELHPSSRKHSLYLRIGDTINDLLEVLAAAEARAASAEQRNEDLDDVNDALRTKLTAAEAVSRRLQEQLEALITTWRGQAQVRSGQTRGRAAMQRDCADDLAALLTGGDASRQLDQEDKKDLKGLPGTTGQADQ